MFLWWINKPSLLSQYKHLDAKDTNETHAFFSEHRRDHRSGLTIFVHPDLARTPLTEPPRPEVQAEVTGAEHVSEEERS